MHALHARGLYIMTTIPASNSKRVASVKRALTYNAITLKQLVEYGENDALKLPYVGKAVWKLALAIHNNLYK